MRTTTDTTTTLAPWHAGPAARAARYVASLRPAMFREAERVALPLAARGDEDARAILVELDRQAYRLAGV